MALDLLKYCSTIRWAASKVQLGVSMMNSSVSKYPNKIAAHKILQGFREGFPLQYTGPRMPCESPFDQLLLVLITNSSLTEVLSLSNIWIVGPSIVYWAQRRALSRPVGRNLGLEKYGVQIRWCGIRGMKWSQLLTRIQRDLRNFPCPHFKSQWRVTFGDETRPSSHFPNYPTLQLSGPVSYLVCFWYAARSQVAIDNVRKRTNREISSYILKLGGRVITESDLSDKETGCYRFDGIYLSDIGNDIYLNALQGALESFLIKDIHKLQST
ncbi:hypothetical protein KUTeg_008019 [Tegillarca granosa]|uniref:Uncharacterized protein n=1 Tax=Tegillarca granosa TaxID=220873 RepID=A0ABQ9FF01_TEGGR|nr:hypothetical protein KUTeg_008019 [Tegillarca granosa]